jgi:ArsR family transcriptional regulator
MASLDQTVDLLGLLGDPTRVRLLALLAHEELTVGELMAIVEIGQSRVSTHLGRLREAGLVRDRRVGSSTYSAVPKALPEPAARVWEVVCASLDDRVLASDRERAELRRRAREGASWPESIAGEMDRHYSPGRTWEATLQGLLAFVQLGDVLDVGSGDGVMAALLAPRARTVTCLDRSERVIAAARARLGGLNAVHFAVGDMHDLPYPEASFDQVLHLHTLPYATNPGRAIAEAARVLRPGGSIALATLAQHQHGEMTAAYGHRIPGFAPDAIATWLAAAGLEVVACKPTSRERRTPHFEVITAHARKPSNILRGP